MKIRRNGKKAITLAEVMEESKALRAELLNTSIKLSLFSKALDREIARLREEQDDANK